MFSHIYIHCYEHLGAAIWRMVVGCDFVSRVIIVTTQARPLLADIVFFGRISLPSFPSRFLNMSVRESSKRTISASGGLELLQMVSGRCANEDAGLPNGVDCKIPCRLERGMKHFL